LCDVDTAVWLDEELAAAAPVVEWLTFHTGAQLTHDPAASDFAFVSAPQTMPPLSAFAEGTPDYPDRSTTVVMQVHAWSGVNVVLSGPGIRTQVAFAAAPLHDDFWQRARENHARFPLGVDLLFTTRDEIAGLPRSTRINGEGE
ncbi:MAG: phosphonate C-P lyase system protein PhnH, partial [Pseudomonadota bacterium]